MPAHSDDDRVVCKPYNQSVKNSNPSMLSWIAVLALPVLFGCSPKVPPQQGSAPATAPAQPQSAPAAQVPVSLEPPRPVRNGTGKATLHWKALPPAVYADNPKKDPVAGFRIYFGPSPEKLAFEAKIDDPKATGYVVERLAPGTWYYAITTVTRLGIESERSPVVSKKIEAPAAGG